MPSLNRREFLAEVCSQVKWKKEHENIRKELSAHMEEKKERLERLGRTPEEAEAEAVAAMGDPIEIGKALNRCHKPYLSWALNLSRVAVVLMTVYFVSITIVPWVLTQHRRSQSIKTDKPLAWSIETDQTQQIDNRIVRLIGADFTKDGELFIYWESELLEPYTEGWEPTLFYSIYDQDGKEIEHQGGISYSGGEKWLISMEVGSEFDPEEIGEIRFVYDEYNRKVEFVLDLSQRREAT